MPAGEVDPQYVEGLLDDLYTFGAIPEGGVFRPAFGQAWMEARRYVSRRMEELGLEVWEDAVGNLFGRWSGQEQGTVLTGSHLDTVRGGGRLDGSLGVVAGLAAVSALRDLGTPKCNVEVVVTCEEEGSRFPAKMPGSRAMAGLLTQEELHSISDGEGTTLAEAMRACGFRPDQVETARRRDIVAFLELHIEQGPKLEEGGHHIGIVDKIVGLSHLEFVFIGRADHAGTTPMSRRRDALVGAADAVVRIEALARSFGDPAVVTVGRLQLWPGSINVVPEKVAFTVDARHTSAETKRKLVDAVVQEVYAVASARGLAVEHRTLAETEPTALDAKLVELLRALAEELRYDAMVMGSGAAHDAQMMGQTFPTAMIFVPSHLGRSHSPDEFTPIEQIMPGIRLLSEAIFRLAF